MAKNAQPRITVALPSGSQVVLGPEDMPTRANPDGGAMWKAAIAATQATMTPAAPRNYMEAAQEGYAPAPQSPVGSSINGWGERGRGGGQIDVAGPPRLYPPGQGARRDVLINEASGIAAGQTGQQSYRNAMRTHMNQAYAPQIGPQLMRSGAVASGQPAQPAPGGTAAIPQFGNVPLPVDYVLNEPERQRAMNQADRTGEKVSLPGLPGGQGSNKIWGRQIHPLQGTTEYAKGADGKPQKVEKRHEARFLTITHRPGVADALSQRDQRDKVLTSMLRGNADPSSEPVQQAAKALADAEKDLAGKVSKTEQAFLDDYRGGKLAVGGKKAKKTEAVAKAKDSPSIVLPRRPSMTMLKAAYDRTVGDAEKQTASQTKKLESLRKEHSSLRDLRASKGLSGTQQKRWDTVDEQITALEGGRDHTGKEVKEGSLAAAQKRLDEATSARRNWHRSGAGLPEDAKGKGEPAPTSTQDESGNTVDLAPPTAAPPTAAAPAAGAPIDLSAIDLSGNIPNPGGMTPSMGTIPMVASPGAPTPPPMQMAGAAGTPAGAPSGPMAPPAQPPQMPQPSDDQVLAEIQQRIDQGEDITTVLLTYDAGSLSDEAVARLEQWLAQRGGGA